MQISSKFEGSHATLSLAGRFDFHSHRDFRNAYEKVLEEVRAKEVEVNFSDVDYLDSSALGMLLLLKEKSDAAGKSVVLSSPRGAVRQVLDIANFGKLFKIVE
ncbi:MAG: STAS domain-containing protein [Betaproteobacteria bacterium]|nr:STAS domain-containing protein [Betaproteobacteria bacterium]